MTPYQALARGFHIPHDGVDDMEIEGEGGR